jgi:hypothetical protein
MARKRTHLARDLCVAHDERDSRREIASARRSFDKLRIALSRVEGRQTRTGDGPVPPHSD